MSKLEMKRWVFEQLLTKLELAKTDQEFVGALAAINTVVQIAARYVDGAFDLIDLASQMKKKAETQSSGSVRQVISQREGADDELVTAADFAEALEKVKPSVSAQMIKDLERWRDAKEKPSGADEEDD